MSNTLEILQQEEYTNHLEEVSRELGLSNIEVSRFADSEQGGMSEVWSLVGVDAQGNRKEFVAKRVSNDFNMQWELLAFNREIWNSAKLNSVAGATTTVYGATQSGMINNIYRDTSGAAKGKYNLMIMEKSPGKKIAELDLDLYRLSNVYAKSALILDEAATNGVLHMDMNSGNILVDEEGAVSIIDWGISYPLDSDVEELTVIGKATGGIAPLPPLTKKIDQQEAWRYSMNFFAASYIKRLLGGSLDSLYLQNPDSDFPDVIQTLDEDAIMAELRKVPNLDTNLTMELIHKACGANPKEHFSGFVDLQFAIQQAFGVVDAAAAA